MKKSVIQLLFVASIFISLISTGCDTDGICRRGNGAILTDTLSLSPFTSIDLVQAASVHVKQGTTQEIIVEADENVLEALKIEVINDELVIDVEGCWFNYDMDVYVTIPTTQPQKSFVVSGSGEIEVEDSLVLDTDFQAIISGSGEIKLTAATPISFADLRISGSGNLILDIETDSTESKVSGSGELQLEGKTITHNSKISGSGDIYAFDFATENTSVNVGGSGDAEVRVEGGTLDVKITGSGNVSYKGTPGSVNSNVTGSGKLTDAN
ncbi:MAG: head GIN domain-containing protein [Bacteroidota bacterium]